MLTDGWQLDAALRESAASRPDLAGADRAAGRRHRHGPGRTVRRAAHPLAAADRAGDGQGRRGPRLLAVPPAGVARRGRRPTRSPSPTRSPPCTVTITQPAPSMADDDAGRHDPRRRPLGGRAGLRPGARRRRRAVGPRRSTSGWPPRRSPTSTCRSSGWRCRPWRRRPSCRPTGSTPSSSRRPGRPTGARRGPSPTTSTSGGSAALAHDVLAWPPLVELAASLDRPGRAVSLAMLAVRATAPGVPDVYQGTEAFRFLLVDPDNRHAARRGRARRARRRLAADVDGQGGVGRPASAAGTGRGAAPPAGRSGRRCPTCSAPAAATGRSPSTVPRRRTSSPSPASTPAARPAWSRSSADRRPRPPPSSLPPGAGATC